MRIPIKQAAEIVDITENEFLMAVQVDPKITAHSVPPNDMTYNEDGTVVFNDEGSSDFTWEFDFNEVIEFRDRRNQRANEQVFLSEVDVIPPEQWKNLET